MSWRDQPQHHPAYRIDGGLLLAEDLVATGRTAPAGHRADSMHADLAPALSRVS